MGSCSFIEAGLKEGCSNKVTFTETEGTRHGCDWRKSTPSGQVSKSRGPEVGRRGRFKEGGVSLTQEQRQMPLIDHTRTCSFSKYFLSISCVPASALGAWNISVCQSDKGPCAPGNLYSRYSHMVLGRQAGNKKIIKEVISSCDKYQKRDYKGVT